MLAALRRDVRAAMDHDPAARSALEVIICYPGVHALAGHRASHWLWRHRAQLPARALAELTRMLTGVDIHPAAAISPGVFIDHATGVVIGETAEIGADVTIYQGVTLGGTSLDQGRRHPTVGDRVVIGAGAKILGPITIGHDSTSAPTPWWSSRRLRARWSSESPGRSSAAAVPARYQVPATRRCPISWEPASSPCSPGSAGWRPWPTARAAAPSSGHPKPEYGTARTSPSD